MNKRVLIIAFHFPPQAASSGIQRTLSFSKYLGRHGWDPMVLSAHPMAYSIKNSSQLTSVPASLVVRRPLALDAKRHLGILGRYPEMFALPDRWSSWWLSAVPAGLLLIRRYRPAVIWSTFPIATSHLIGLTLHKLTGIPWVADFRDPMLQPDYPVTKWQRKVFGWIERLAVRHCGRAVFTTHSAMSAYIARFPDLPRSKFSVIENGYDEDGFGGERTQAACTRGGKKITLLHSGVLYAEGRNPSAFLQAIARLKSAGLVGADSLAVILRATGDDTCFEDMVARYAVQDIVAIAPPIPYREALNEMLAVDGLLVFQGTPFNTQVPAKIYEYFRARRPILGLVDPRGETARILQSAGFPDLAAMDGVDEITEKLMRFIEEIRRGTAYCATDEVVVASSREHRTRELANLFDEIIPA